MIPGADKSQAFNRYMYVLGNPVRYCDPSGNFPENGPGAPGPGQSNPNPGSATGPGAPSGDHDNSWSPELLFVSNEVPSIQLYLYVQDYPSDYYNNGLQNTNGISNNNAEEQFNSIATVGESILDYASTFGDGVMGALLDSVQSVPADFLDSVSFSTPSSDSHSNKGLFDRIVDGVQQWGQNITSGPRAFGAYLGNHRAAGLAACVGGALFGVAYTFAAEYVVAAKTLEALDLTTGVLNGVIPDSPPPWLNSLPLAIGWALANFRKPIGAYISDIWSELKKVKMEIDR